METKGISLYLFLLFILGGFLISISRLSGFQVRTWKPWQQGTEVYGNLGTGI